MATIRSSGGQLWSKKIAFHGCMPTPYVSEGENDDDDDDGFEDDDDDGFEQFDQIFE